MFVTWAVKAFRKLTEQSQDSFYFHIFMLGKSYIPVDQDSLDAKHNPLAGAYQFLGHFVQLE